MAALGRFLRPTSLSTSRRFYSVFSSKPGGGRYFNSAKPPKVVATNHRTKRNADEQTSSSSSSSPSASASGSTNNSSSTGTADGNVLTSSSPLSQPAEDIQSPPAKKAMPLSPSAAPPVESVTPPVPFHPSFTAQTYPLHQFFSVHRPLFNLFLPTSNLFEAHETSSNDMGLFSGTDPESILNNIEQRLQSQMEESGADADADAARQLARALAINRLGGAVNWDDTLARLGDMESILAQQRLGERVSLPSVAGCVEEEMTLDSTKRKRRKKMSKHK